MWFNIFQLLVWNFLWVHPTFFLSWGPTSSVNLFHCLILQGRGCLMPGVWWSTVTGIGGLIGWSVHEVTVFLGSSMWNIFFVGLHVAVVPKHWFTVGNYIRLKRGSLHKNEAIFYPMLQGFGMPKTCERHCSAFFSYVDFLDPNGVAMVAKFVKICPF